MGTDVARAVRGLPILSGSAGNGSNAQTNHSSHLPKIHRDAQQRQEAEGKQLCSEEKAKRDKNALEMWSEIESRSEAGEFPKGNDVFLSKYHGLFFVAPAQQSYMCRMRLPGGVLSSAQLHGVANIAENCAGGYLDVTTRANLQLREIPASRG